MKRTFQKSVQFSQEEIDVVESAQERFTASFSDVVRFCVAVTFNIDTMHTLFEKGELNKIATKRFI